MSEQAKVWYECAECGAEHDVPRCPFGAGHPRAGIVPEAGQIAEALLSIFDPDRVTAWIGRDEAENVARVIRDLLARLHAVEQERDELTERLELMKVRHNSRAEAAEATVATLTEALEQRGLETAAEWWAEFDAHMARTIKMMARDDDAVATFDRIAWLASKLAALAATREEQ